MELSKIVEQILKVTNESNYGWLDMDSVEAGEIWKILNKELNQGQKLPIHIVSDMLCGSFDADNSTSSATKCKCGREKWEHPKPRN